MSWRSSFVNNNREERMEQKIEKKKEIAKLIKLN
jgi:hypothetical protein